MRRLSVWNPWNVSPRLVDWDDMDMMDMGNISMDVYEEGDKLVAKVVSPGFKRDQLDISIESGMLTVVGKAEEVAEEEGKNRKYYRKEISQRSFTRTCDLPFPVVAENAQAKFEDGVLTVTLPKSEEAKPKKITLDVK